MIRLLLAVAAGTGIASLVGLVVDPSALHLALFLLAAPAAWLLAVAEWRARRRAAGTTPARPSTPVVVIVGVAVAGLVLTPVLLPADDDASAAQASPLTDAGVDTRDAADGNLIEMRGGAPGSAAEKATPEDTGNAG